MFDARNFFSADVEPLKQHQFGATVGGPIARDRLLFFGYYEGFRNKQGTTTTATVPTAAERQGDFSGMGTPLLNLAAGGVPFPGNQIPGGGDQPGRAQRARSLSARQRLAVDLSRDARRHERPRLGRRPHRFQRVAEQPDLRPLLVFRRPQHQSDLGPGHRRAGLPHARRPRDARGDAVEHAHPLAVADQHACAARFCGTSSSSTSGSTGRRRARSGSATPRRTRSARDRRSSTSAATRRSAAPSPDRATPSRTPSKCRTA